MDIKIEKEFIQTYIKRDYQERILYELTKKRERHYQAFEKRSYNLNN